jgi:hypothetical protein
MPMQLARVVTSHASSRRFRTILMGSSRIDRIDAARLFCVRFIQETYPGREQRSLRLFGKLHVDKGGGI